ncbi:MAG: hypothetical protein ACRCX2_37135 [Paraclostridium sp.]
MVVIDKILYASRFGFIIKPTVRELWICKKYFPDVEVIFDYNKWIKEKHDEIRGV